MDIHIDIKGDHQVGLRFEEFPDDIYAQLKAEIASIGAELLARVRAATPSRSGRLRSEERLRLFTDPHRISAYVDVAGQKGSTDFGKAAALEYGAHKATSVRAHSMRLDHNWTAKLAAPEMVMVAAYTRTPNIEEHRFERGPLAEMQGEILERLNAVIEKAAVKANA